MTTDPQKVWLDRTSREALREYAWANRTTMGDVIRAAVEDVRDNPGSVSALSMDDGRSEVQLSVVVDDKVWADARKAASESGVGSFTSLVRRRVRKILIDEGFMS